MDANIFKIALPFYLPTHLREENTMNEFGRLELIRESLVAVVNEMRHIATYAGQVDVARGGARSDGDDENVSTVGGGQLSQGILSSVFCECRRCMQASHSRPCRLGKESCGCSMASMSKIEPKWLITSCFVVG